MERRFPAVRSACTPAHPFLCSMPYKPCDCVQPGWTQSTLQIATGGSPHIRLPGPQERHARMEIGLPGTQERYAQKESCTRHPCRRVVRHLIRSPDVHTYNPTPPFATGPRITLPLKRPAPRDAG